MNQLKDKYLVYKDRINRQPIEVSKLVLSNADKQYFENIIANRPLEESRDSHKKLKKAFQKICSYVDQTVDCIPNIDDKIDALGDFDNIIHNNCTIITIPLPLSTYLLNLHQALQFLLGMIFTS